MTEPLTEAGRGFARYLNDVSRGSRDSSILDIEESIAAIEAEAAANAGDGPLDVDRLARALHTATHIGDLHVAGEGWCGEEAAAIAKAYGEAHDDR